MEEGIDGMIALQAVEKLYQTHRSTVHALKNISFEVNSGEIFGVIGRTGAGKSTLIRCINLLERPTRGNVMIDQLPLTSLDSQSLRLARHCIGTVLQPFTLLESRTIYDNVALPLKLAGKSKTDIHKIVQPLLVLSGLADKIHAYPRQLNGAAKQRVAIARALVHRPKVLLCDEVTRSLDPKGVSSVLQLLRSIHEQFNLTILLTSADIGVIKSICDRVAVLHQGEIIEQNAILNLFANPQTQLSKELVRTHTRLELPAAYRRRLRPQASNQSNPVFRISLVGADAQEPLIGQVMQQYQLTINIMQAHLETIRDRTIGIMIVEVTGELNNINQAREFLESKDLYMEVLGYAAQPA